METNDEKKARVTFKQPEKECPICNGSGEVQQTDVDWDDCRRCNGTGKVQPEAAGQPEKCDRVIKSIQQCKDEAAISIGYESMEELFQHLGHHSINEAKNSQFFLVLDKAAELYAKQFEQPEAAGQEQERHRLIKFIRYLKSNVLIDGLAFSPEYLVDKYLNQQKP